MNTDNIITYRELIDRAHQMELASITTEIVQLPDSDNAQTAIFRATVTMGHGENTRLFQATGDANPTNCSRQMQNCLIRLSETRAIARALRIATNSGGVADAEMSEYTEGKVGGKTGGKNGEREFPPRSAAGFDRLQPILDTQKQAIVNICKQSGKAAPDMEGWSAGDAADHLAKLQKKAA